jgi:hypothetical protein
MYYVVFPPKNKKNPLQNGAVRAKVSLLKDKK